MGGVLTETESRLRVAEFIRSRTVGMRMAELFFYSPNRFISNAEIWQQVWGSEFLGKNDGDSIRMGISHARPILAQDSRGFHLLSVSRYHGYIFCQGQEGKEITIPGLCNTSQIGDDDLQKRLPSIVERGFIKLGENSAMLVIPRIPFYQFRYLQRLAQTPNLVVPTSELELMAEAGKLELEDSNAIVRVSINQLARSLDELQPEGFDWKIASVHKSSCYILYNGKGNGQPVFLGNFRHPEMVKAGVREVLTLAVRFGVEVQKTRALRCLIPNFTEGEAD